MNAPTKAAFRASFSDWKLIRSRKVVQLVFEVPIEAADQAYAILGGMPNPAAEVWCAIARLMPQTEAQADKSVATRKPIDPERRLARQAAMMCGEPKFWRFLRDELNLHCSDKETAAELVRSLCRVASRSEIVLNTPAGRAWDEIYSKYRAWDYVA